MLDLPQLRELIASGPVAASGAAGLAEAERRFAPKGVNNYPVVEERHQRFLASLAGTRTGTTGYRHPARAAHGAHGDGGLAEATRRFGQAEGETGDLSAADLAWLAQLPEADKVTWHDSVELARLAARAQPGPVARLVAAKWEPVRRRHDRAEAEAALTAARQAWPAVPEEEAIDATVATLERDPEVAGVLSESELRTRARQLVAEAVAARDDAYRDGIAAAERQVADVQREQSEREALTA